MNWTRPLLLEVMEAGCFPVTMECCRFWKTFKWTHRAKRAPCFTTCCVHTAKYKRVSGTKATIAFQVSEHILFFSAVSASHYSINIFALRCRCVERTPAFSRIYFKLMLSRFSKLGICQEGIRPNENARMCFGIACGADLQCSPTGEPKSGKVQPQYPVGYKQI